MSDVFLPVSDRVLTHARNIALETRDKATMARTTDKRFWEFVQSVNDMMHIDAVQLYTRPSVMQQLYDSWEFQHPIDKTAQWVMESIDLELQ